MTIALKMQRVLAGARTDIEYGALTSPKRNSIQLKSVGASEKCFQENAITRPAFDVHD